MQKALKFSLLKTGTVFPLLALIMRGNIQPPSLECISNYTKQWHPAILFFKLRRSYPLEKLQINKNCLYPVQKSKQLLF
ncbi:hypothetical protein Peur_022999 [Populus x canadensis]